MERKIWVPIKVDDIGNCNDCNQRTEDHYSQDWCPFGKVNDKRLNDCLDADITDIVAENEALKKEVAKYKRMIGILHEYPSTGSYCSHIRGWTCKYINKELSCLQCVINDALEQAAQSYPA